MSVYGGGGYGAPMGGQPKVRFDAIGEAWKMTQANFGVWVPTLLVYFLVILAASFVTSLIQAAIIGTGGDSSATGMSIIVSLISQVVITGMTAFFMGGLMRMAVKQVKGKAIAVNDLFTGGDVIVNVFLALLLMQLGTTLGVFACIVPGLLMAALWMLTLPLVVDQRISAVDAMSRSWNTLKGDMWTALGVLFVSSLLSGLGVFACGVGVLWTAPIALLTQAIIYRDFFLGGGYGSMPESYPQYPPQGPQPPPYQQNYPPQQGGYPPQDGGGYPPQQR